MTPNTALIREDAARIAALPPERFDMNQFGYAVDAIRGECKRAAGIGGWVRAWHSVGRLSIAEASISRWGISSYQTCRLMYSWRAVIKATPFQASRAMLRLADELDRDPHWSGDPWAGVMGAGE